MVGDQHDITRDELTKSIIGTISDVDEYLLPDAKGYVSLQRYLIRSTEETRQRMRDEILSTTGDHFRAFAEVLGEVKKAGLIKVLGSRKAVEQVLADRPGWVSLTQVL